MLLFVPFDAGDFSEAPVAGEDDFSSYVESKLVLVASWAFCLWVVVEAGCWWGVVA